MKYKGILKVTKDRTNRKIDPPKYKAQLSNKGLLDSKWNGPIRDTEREAAIDYDKKLISLGRDPVNILKPKS